MVYLGPSQRSMTEFCENNGQKPLIIQKNSIEHVWQGLEYDTAFIVFYLLFQVLPLLIIDINFKF